MVPALVSSNTLYNLLSAKNDLTVCSLPLDIPSVPMNAERKAYRHKFNIKPRSNDDELDINTQSSTHWDGLRHVGYQNERLFYNGMTQDEICGARSSDRLGIHS